MLETEIPEKRPLVALTMGDVAGVGPEVIARAWSESPMRDLARPFVIGNAEVLERALRLFKGSAKVRPIDAPEQAEPTAELIPCLDPASIDVSGVLPGRIDRRAGLAASEYLVRAADLALAGRIDAVTTLPINKESLNAAGVAHPGHTEILAERCRSPEHAMMLYLSPPTGGPDGLGVLHATLHVALRKVFDLLTTENVEAKIELADSAFRPLTRGRPPRIAVADQVDRRERHPVILFIK